YGLFRSVSGGFEPVADQTGIRRASFPYGGWGTKLADLDNDGWKDLFVAQGHVMDTISHDLPKVSYEQPLLLLKNEAGLFTDVSHRAGPAFPVLRASRGAAFGDYDNDGFIDIIVSNNDGPALLLRNAASGGNWLIIELKGTISNRDAIGATVLAVDDDGRKQWQFVSTASSYLSASDSRVHFGLGKSRRLASLEVHWPSGRKQILKDVAANQVLRVTEPH
ncbi:MAG: CRTAC1 family protein, partial [Bryobacteraceae bacterium]